MAEHVWVERAEGGILGNVMLTQFEHLSMIAAWLEEVIDEAVEAAIALRAAGGHWCKLEVTGH